MTIFVLDYGETPRTVLPGGLKRESGENPELCPQLYVPIESFGIYAIAASDLRCGEKARSWDEPEDLPSFSPTHERPGAGGL